MRTLTQDLRYALRGLVRNPGFASAAIATLAIGIGANAALFSIVNTMVLRPMPGLADPGRLAWIAYSGRGPRRIAYPDVLEYRAETRLFSGVAALDRAPVHVAVAGDTERLEAQIASGDYFGVLGVVPAAGRTFTSDDDRARRPVAVVSSGFAERRFGTASAAVGRPVLLSGRPFTIVGVAPAGFHGLDIEAPTDFYVPLETWLAGKGPAEAGALSDRSRERFSVIARLQPGVGAGAAHAAVAAIAARHAAERPAERGPVAAGIEAPRGWVPPGHLGEIVPLAAIGFAATGVVLLVAAANVANLLLARGALRRREIGIRLAIGASRGRIVRQLLTESVLLASFGASGGVLLSSWLVDVVLARLDAPPLLRPVLDERMLAYAVAASIATGILFGLAPAWTFARHRLDAALKGSGPGGPPAGQRLQGGLVVAQVALSLVLLAAGGLLLRSLSKAVRVPVGFDRGAAGDILTVSFDPVTQGYSPEKAQRFREDLLERARSLPGVRAAALTEVLPLGRRAISEDYTPEGAASDSREHAYLTSTSPGYLATMGIPLLAGRDFRPDDRAGATRVAIVNETFARRAWPGHSPLGRRFSVADTPVSVSVAAAPATSYEVVGVTSDGKYVDLTEESRSFVYFPIAQETHVDDAVLMVRTSGGPSPAAALRAAVKDLDPAMPLFHTRTMAESLDAKAGDRRAGTWLLALFGGLALILAAVGLYGVVAFAVGARRREIGIRLALGATSRDVVGLFLGRGARLAGAGVLVGLVLAAAATRLLSGMLFGVTPLDLTTLAGVSALLFAVAIGASGIPARRAALIDPVRTLRDE